MSVDARVLRWIGQYLLLTLLAAIVLFPIYITIVNSLIRPTQITSQPPTLFPTHPHVDSYSTAWEAGHLGLYLKNSAIVTNVTTVSDIGWYNTYAGLAVPFLATGFGAFLMRQTFLTLPRELRDAASLDGYGHWRFMTRVAVPLARPAVAALGVFAFLSAWNQYLWPLLVTKDQHLRTVQIGLNQLKLESIDQVNVTFAGVVVGPPLFAALVAATGSYRIGFVTFGCISAACGAWLLRRKLGT